ncbi:MAG TPA: hypothetical protein VF647_02190 [Longimicrobium sp.]
MTESQPPEAQFAELVRVNSLDFMEGFALEVECTARRQRTRFRVQAEDLGCRSKENTR